MKHVDSAYKIKKISIESKCDVIFVDISKILFILVCVSVCAYALFLFLAIYDDKYTKNDEITARMALECENGSWMELSSDKNLKTAESDEKATFSGVITTDMRDGIMKNKDRNLTFATDKNFSLIFYDNREVEIVGRSENSLDKGVIYVDRIKCIGKEAREDIKTMRQDMMQYISQNKENIISGTTSNMAFDIEDITFVDDNVVYVYFVQKQIDNGHQMLLLIQLDGSNGTYASKKLAEYSLIDHKFELIEGVDVYTHSRQSTYEYDENLKKWLLIW